jgi:hypothetical protein
VKLVGGWSEGRGGGMVLLVCVCLEENKMKWRWGWWSPVESGTQRRLSLQKYRTD